jgi:NADH-quinone oxidoreductase subunit C
MNRNLIRTLEEKFPAQVTGSHIFRGDETVTIRREALPEVAKHLRDGLGFEFLMDLTAVDYPEREDRFEMVYHFYSLKTNLRLRLKAPVSGITPVVASLTPLWSAANWFEREVYDMFGIKFEGHPDLRRILMYDTFEGHPLRKDYPLKKRQPRIQHRE